MKRVAVVLFNLGGPTDLKAVKPFLFNLFNDPQILRMPAFLRFILAKLISTLRYKKARGIYERMGGKSPLVEHTVAQGHALEKAYQDVALQALIHKPFDLKTFVCMRYWHPLSPAVIKDLENYAPDALVLLPLYPQYSTTTTQSSFMDFHRHLKKSPTLTQCLTYFVGCYPTHPNLIDAFVENLQTCLDKSTPHGRPIILFSAHGLPQDIVDQGDPYPIHIEATSNQVIHQLKDTVGDIFDTKICYQSKVGPKKWLEPATADMIKTFAQDKRPLIVVPIAFVSDHSETLVELDQDYKKLALDYGAPSYERCQSLNTHPKFIQGLLDLVLMSLQKKDTEQERLCPKGSACGCKNNK